MISLAPTVTGEDVYLGDLSFTEEQGQKFINAARTAGQGMSFSTGDEIEAAIKTMIGDKSYGENIDAIRSGIKGFEDENPTTSQALFWAGILPTMTVAAPKLAMTVLSRFNPIAQSSILGAAGMGLEGFAAGEGVEDRTSEAMAMGALGLILGPTTVVGAMLAQRVAPQVKGFLASLKTKVTGAKLPEPRNEQEAMAKKILEMRAAGESKEVTDDMMKIADDQYMFKNTPLDMSPEARLTRADEMGFTQTLHGTKSDITAVDRSFFGNPEAENKLGSGFYTTTNPKRANNYAPTGNPELPRGVFQSGNDEFTDGSNIMPLMIREPMPFNLEEPTGKAADKIAEVYSSNPNFKVESMSSGTHIVSNESGSAFLDSYQPKHVTLNNLRKAFGPDNVSNTLSEVGYSGVSGPEALGTKVAVSYNPENVRSKFARMDPEFSHLKNLSAAMAAGIPLGALGFFADNEEYYQDM